MPMYHGGPCGLDEITPGALREPGGNPRVYVTPHLLVAQSYILRYRASGAVYEVEPRGSLVRIDGNEFTCDSAEIISVVWEFRRNGEG